mmetsp:Transcript_49990/g.130204  ORF Transcript_49990/g.130204 Transcript_49990/m.130204 type:complete len:282 (+) Transcript_49990:248-1093(+)
MASRSVARRSSAVQPSDFVSKAFIVELILSPDIEHRLESLVLALTELKLPCFRFMIMNYVNVLIKNTAIAAQLKHKEVRRHWYYNWLGRCKRLTTANIRPLEITRAQWATPENVATHYDMLAAKILELELGVRNPHYDPTVPYSEQLKITKPHRIASMDETHLTNDTTTVGKSKCNRTLAKKSKKDAAECLVNKGGGDGMGIGGTTADGLDLPAFFIFANDIIHRDDVKGSPSCRRPNPENPSEPMPCRFWTNEKGGVTGDLGVRTVCARLRGALHAGFVA